MQAISFKCILIGDRTVGKTSLLLSYGCNVLPCEYVPHFAEEGTVNLMIDKQPVILNIWDSTGQEIYKCLSDFQDTIIFVMCFSIVSPQSLENIEKEWFPKISHFCPNSLLLLVGTKLDLREDKDTIREMKEKKEEPLTYEQGVEMARKIRAINYIECSSLTQQGLTEIFEVASRKYIKHYKKMRKKAFCKIL